MGPRPKQDGASKQSWPAATSAWRFTRPPNQAEEQWAADATTCGALNKEVAVPQRVNEEAAETLEMDCQDDQSVQAKSTCQTQMFRSCRKVMKSMQQGAGLMSLVGWHVAAFERSLILEVLDGSWEKAGAQI